MLRTPRATEAGRKSLPLALLIISVVLLFHTLVSRAQCPAGVQWKQLGPAPLIIDPPNGADGQGPDSGLVSDLAIDPSGSSDQTLYVATEGGGIWKSTNGGTHWSPKTELMPSLTIGTLALDPGNPAIVYAGTGNPGSARGSFLKGAGIYKSVNGGDAWTIFGGSTFTNIAINRIVVPASNVLLVASRNGLYQSFDGGTNFSVLSGGNWTDLDIDTASASTVYASRAGFGVYKLINAGVTFLISGNLFTSSNGAPLSSSYIAFAQSTLPNSQTMYANVWLATGPNPVGLYKSTDKGTNWSSVTLGAEVLAQAGNSVGYAQTVGVDPQNANFVYFGLISLFLSTNGCADGIYDKTQNAIEPHNNRIDLNKVHADQHALVFSPVAHWAGLTTTRVYNGSDGGIATAIPTTSESAANWTLLNGDTDCAGENNALATILVRQIDMGRGSTSDNLYTYAVAQDLGLCSRRLDCAGTPWRQVSGGDGWAVAVDPLNGKHAIAFDDCCLLSTKDGSSWGAGPSGFPAPPRWFYFDPSGGKAYAIGNSGDSINLYLSTDNANSFSVMHSFTPSLSLNGVSINVAKTDSDTIWVGLGDGTVAYTSDADLGSAAHWSTPIQITGSPSLGASGIAIDPANAAQIVVVYPSAQALSQVFMTTNNGATWANISGNLPNVPVRALVIDANTFPHSIIVASDAGVSRTRDFGSTWQAPGAGLPTVPCTSLALDSTATPSLLRVGTYGRSAFELAYDRKYVSTACLPPFLYGTRELPFCTVTQAINAAPNGDAKVIIIQSGDYQETPPRLTISQCCTLMAINGPATIR